MPFKILQTLPAPIIDSAIGQESYRSDSGSEVDDLKIAWKYKSLSVNPVIPTISGIGHHFDLSQKMAKESVECVKPHVFTFNEVDCNRSVNPDIHDTHRHSYTQIVVHF